MMVRRDPPAHTRLRALVTQALIRPHAIEALRPRIQARVNTLLDTMRARADQVGSEGFCDIIQDFAFPLPAAVICDVIGIPLEDQAQFKAWGD